MNLNVSKEVSIVAWTQTIKKCWPLQLEVQNGRVALGNVKIFYQMNKHRVGIWLKNLIIYIPDKWKYISMEKLAHECLQQLY